MHFYKTPDFVKRLIPGLVWGIHDSENEVFLTFDDGPVPGVTDWVLDELYKINARATFFVVGENVKKYPNLYARMIEEGHCVGNHTFNHMNAWKSNSQEYLDNIEKCQQVLGTLTNTTMFRPPHGKLTPGLVSKIKRKYRIIMWGVLSGDYDSSISSDECLKKSLSNTSPGSIVVFHDSYKAEGKLKKVLPDYLKELQNRGYYFSTL